LFVFLTIFIFNYIFLLKFGINIVLIFVKTLFGKYIEYNILSKDVDPLKNSYVLKF